jgi:hypothetical protein
MRRAFDVTVPCASDTSFTESRGKVTATNVGVLRGVEACPSHVYRQTPPNALEALVEAQICGTSASLPRSMSPPPRCSGPHLPRAQPGVLWPVRRVCRAGRLGQPARLAVMRMPSVEPASHWRRVVRRVPEAWRERQAATGHGNRTAPAEVAARVLAQLGP